MLSLCHHHVGDGDDYDSYVLLLLSLPFQAFYYLCHLIILVVSLSEVLHFLLQPLVVVGADDAGPCSVRLVPWLQIVDMIDFSSFRAVMGSQK